MAAALAGRSSVQRSVFYVGNAASHFGLAFGRQFLKLMLESSAEWVLTTVSHGVIASRCAA
jgi:hypothetical protein